MGVLPFSFSVDKRNPRVTTPHLYQSAHDTRRNDHDSQAQPHARTTGTLRTLLQAATRLKRTLDTLNYLNIYYPSNFGCFDKTGVFQQPLLFTEVTVRALRFPTLRRDRAHRAWKVPRQRMQGVGIA